MQLPRAPEAIRAEEEAAAARQEAAQRVAYEEDSGALRSFRMALRGIVTACLVDRRFRDFVQAPLPEEDPDYWQQVPPSLPWPF